MIFNTASPNFISSWTAPRLLGVSTSTAPSFLGPPCDGRLRRTRPQRRKVGAPSGQADTYPLTSG
eukprot:4439288-Prymnesium_polylepis.1